MKDFFAEEIIEEKPKRVRVRNNGGHKKVTGGPPYAQGRKCIYPGCITILNTHTKGPSCSLHEGADYERKMKENMLSYNSDGSRIKK